MNKTQKEIIKHLEGLLMNTEPKLSRRAAAKLAPAIPVSAVPISTGDDGNWEIDDSDREFQKLIWMFNVGVYATFERLLPMSNYSPKEK